MAIIVKVILEHQLIVGEFRDEMRREDLRHFVDVIDHSPEVNADFNMLTFLPDGLKFHITGEELRELGRRKPQLSLGSKRVIVASDQLTYGFSRMYTSMTNLVTDRFCIFSELESACEYLGIMVADLDLEARR